MINDSKLLRAALIFIACTSFIVCGVQPIFMGLVTEQLSLSLDQQGWVVSVEMIGMTLGTLLCPTLMKRHAGRSLCLSVGALCVALSVATAFASTNAVLLIVRLAAGTCAGLVYAYAVSTLGRLPNQDRSFGLMLLLQTPEYSLFSAALPMLAAQSGTVTALCAFGLWYLLICGASLVLPRRPAVSLASGEGSPAQGGRRARGARRWWACCSCRSPSIACGASSINWRVTRASTLSISAGRSACRPSVACQGQGCQACWGRGSTVS
ncbi:MFS transporter [Pseudomonas putida]|uniref:MFS transporter n=1 Tax=Pseudomonas putida TaxID=303 RepID=UPI002156379A|nr:MFS transporter [Pseudomonas putida]